MRRNLKSRVEIITPVEDPALQQELNAVFEAQLNDHRSVWDMQADGCYVQRQPDSRQKQLGGQQVMIASAEKRQVEANRLRKRKLKGIARRATQ